MDAVATQQETSPNLQHIIEAFTSCFNFHVQFTLKAPYCLFP